MKLFAAHAKDQPDIAPAPTILADEAGTVFGPKAGDNEDLQGSSMRGIGSRWCA